MSKYRPRETFIRMLRPPSNGSFLFSSSRKTEPFLDSCEKFLVKYSLMAVSVIMNDFFFFLSISVMIFWICSCSFWIVSTFSWISLTCSPTVSKTSRARMFTLPNLEMLNCAFWSRSFSWSVGIGSNSICPNSKSSDFIESVWAMNCAFWILLWLILSSKFLIVCCAPMMSVSIVFCLS